VHLRALRYHELRKKLQALLFIELYDGASEGELDVSEGIVRFEDV
jgi:hypothetical protein